MSVHDTSGTPDRNPGETDLQSSITHAIAHARIKGSNRAVDGTAVMRS